MAEKRYCKECGEIIDKYKHYCQLCKEKRERERYYNGKEGRISRQKYYKIYNSKEENKKRQKIKCWERMGIKPNNNDWEYIFKLQKEQTYCQICGISGNDVKNDLALDHNHKNGRPRGFLCFKCNSALGFFKDNIDILRSAVSYLKFYK